MSWSLALAGATVAAHELTDAGLDVIAIERGPWRDAPTDFPITYVQDELRYRIRHELFLRPAQTTFTFRNTMDQRALPIRTWGAFMPPNGVGGGGVHWNAGTWRFLPSDFVLKTHLTERYGASFLPPDMTIQDWGVTYQDLEPHYDQFEYLCGTSGQAGNLRGADPGRRKPIRGFALAALSHSSADAGLQPRAFRQGRARSRLQALPAALGQSLAALCQSARRPDGRLQLLRLLRMVRLRQLFESESADDDSAGASAQVELRFSDQFGGDAHQSRCRRPAGDGGNVRGRERRGMGAAGGTREFSRLIRCSTCSSCCCRKSASHTTPSPIPESSAATSLTKRSRT